MSFFSGIFGGSTEVQADNDGSSPTKKVRLPTLHDTPRIVYDMVNSEGEDAIVAARKLYELCDVAHKQNRVPMVCSGKYDVLTPLTNCLLQHDNEEKLHLVCLTLNNLSIPEENKRIFSLERGFSQRLIKNLLSVISAGKKSAYLCLICLLNMSYLDASLKVIGQFSPKERAQKAIAPLENPDSLLRILQDLLAHAARGTADFRWAFGLLANLARNPENASLIGLTAAPKQAVETLKLAKEEPEKWNLNSLEDFSLFLILHLAESAPEALADTEALELCKDIMKLEGTIQGLKATMVCALLDAPWSAFSGFGFPAAASVSELMVKTFEREGKKGVYLDNAFRLPTATKAYYHLAKAAVKADLDDSATGELKAKVVALPTAVAQLFQIVADVALESVDDNDTYVADEVAAEHAVAAIVSLLPILTQGENPARRSRLTETACNHLIQVLRSYASKIKSVTAKGKAKEAVEKLKANAESALPVLEASYELWIHYNSPI